MRFFDTKSSETSKTEKKITQKDDDLNNELSGRSSSGYQYRWNYDSYQHMLQKKKRRTADKGLRKFSIVVCSAFLLCFVILVGIIFCEILYKGEEVGTASQEETNQPRSDFPGVAPVNHDVRDLLSLQEISEKGKNFVVGLLVQTEKEHLAGTGVILTEDGYVVTNYHVIREGKSCEAVMYDGTRYETTMIGFDESSDIAVLKINGDGFIAADLGISSTVTVGDMVAAIGMPPGMECDEDGRIAEGIISGINENITLKDTTSEVNQRTMTVLQTTAVINSENTGGPLLNQYGEVIGINAAELSENHMGTGFALSIKNVIPIVNEIFASSPLFKDSEKIIDDEDETETSIGMKGTDINECQASLYNLPLGILVYYVNADSNAAKADLRCGDVIVKFNNTPVKSLNALKEMKESYKPGDKVCLQIYRRGTLKDIYFNLDAAQ